MDDVIAAIGIMQRHRKFWIKSEGRDVKSFQALVRMSLATPRGDDKANERARKISAAAIAGKTLPGEVSSLAGVAEAFRLRMLPTKASRGSTERDMKRLARTLPGAQFAASVKGFGELGFAVIVGEAGDLAGYSSESKLWRRLGLAPFCGKSGSTWRREGGLSAAEWTEYGYSGHRRAEVYATVQDSLFRWQTHSAGPYRAVYDRRRARAAAAHPDWAPARLHADAGRVMVKALIKDLWRAWRDATDAISEFERPGRSTYAEMARKIVPEPLNPTAGIEEPGPASCASMANVDLPALFEPALVIGIDAGGLDGRIALHVEVQP